MFMSIGVLGMILLVPTLIIVGIVKGIMYVSGKPITTPNKRTRKLIGWMVSITVSALGIAYIQIALT